MTMHMVDYRRDYSGSCSMAPRSLPDRALVRARAVLSVGAVFFLPLAGHRESPARCGCRRPPWSETHFGFRDAVLDLALSAFETPRCVCVCVCRFGRRSWEKQNTISFSTSPVLVHYNSCRVRSQCVVSTASVLAHHHCTDRKWPCHCKCLTSVLPSEYHHSIIVVPVQCPLQYQPGPVHYQCSSMHSQYSGSTARVQVQYQKSKIALPLHCQCSAVPV